MRIHSLNSFDGRTLFLACSYQLLYQLKTTMNYEHILNEQFSHFKLIKTF